MFKIVGIIKLNYYQLKIVLLISTICPYFYDYEYIIIVMADVWICMTSE